LTTARSARDEILAKEPQLCLEVGLHRAVQIEVVLGQVAKGRHVELHAADAPERKTMRGDLHRHHIATSVDHLREQRLQLHGRRRRKRRWDFGITKAIGHGAHQARSMTGRAQKAFEQRGGGGLAVGAGHAHRFELFGWLVVKAARGDPQHARWIVAAQIGHRDVERLAAADNRHRAVFDRLRCIGVPIDGQPLDGEKEMARLHLSRVFGQSPDRQSGDGRVPALGRQELAKKLIEAFCESGPSPRFVFDVYCPSPRFVFDVHGPGPRFVFDVHGATLTRGVGPGKALCGAATSRHGGSWTTKRTDTLALCCGCPCQQIPSRFLFPSTFVSDINAPRCKQRPYNTETLSS
jgi:hypothetical protein